MKNMIMWITCILFVVITYIWINFIIIISTWINLFWEIFNSNTLHWCLSISTPMLTLYFISFFKWMFLHSLSLTLYFFNALSWKKTYIVSPHSIEPRILTLVIWNDSVILWECNKIMKKINNFIVKNKTFLQQNSFSLVFISYVIT